MEEPRPASTAKSFLERIRNPDPAFPRFLQMLSLTVPFSIAFFFLGLFVIQILFTAVLGPDALLTSLVGSIVWVVERCTVPAVLVSVVGLWALRAYVATKLRHARPDRSEDPVG